MCSSVWVLIGYKNVKKQYKGFFKVVMSLTVCPGYDAKLIWSQQRNDIVSVTAICAAAVGFLFFRIRPTVYIASLRDGPLGRISLNIYTAKGLCSIL